MPKLLNLAVIVCTVLFFAKPLAAQDKPTLNILFLGNSYTSHHNVPGILETLLNQDPDSPVKANIETTLVNGFSLKDHWEKGDAQEKIKSRINWNFIILQNQSNWASEKQALEDAREYAAKFAEISSYHGGVILIPET